MRSAKLVIYPITSPMLTLNSPNIKVNIKVTNAKVKTEWNYEQSVQFTKL